MDLYQLPGLMTQASRLAKLEPARLLIKAASVAAVDNAGILKLKVLYTVNIKMVFYHPNYYKKLRASLKKEAISPEGSTDPDGRAPEQQASSGTGPGAKLQASSSKQQASSTKLVQVPDASFKPRG